MRETYAQKLRDPRWRKMRMRILKRDNNTCRCCGHMGLAMHVHHLVYFRDLEPWEYSKMYLVTLCEYCHQQTHRGRVLVLMPRTPRERGTNPRRVFQRQLERESA